MARDMRIDAYLAAFIQQWLARTAAGAIKAGNRCWYSGNCAAGAGDCVPALDDATISFCAPACSPDCPGALVCLADGNGARLCRHPTPSPFAQGAFCTDDSQCDSGHCLAPAGKNDRVCTQICFPDLPGFCGDGYSCGAASGGAPQSACFATPKSGCAMGGAIPSSGARVPWLLGLGLALLALRRRRARVD
jgi:hypothetical protein